MATRDSNRPLVVTHVPKSGGSSIYEALREALQPQHPRVAIDETNLASCGLRGMSRAYRRRFVLTTDPAFDCDYLSGHVSYPHSRRRVPDGQHIIVMREPRARVMSHWLFTRSFTPFELWAWGEWGDHLRLTHGSLLDFLVDPRVACMYDNLTLRLLVGPDERIPVEGLIAPEHDQELLALARQRMRQYDFVGLLEDPELVSKLESWLGRDLNLQRINEARPLPKRRRPDIGDEVQKALPVLEDRTRLDRELWVDVVSSQLGVDPIELAEQTLNRSVASQRDRMSATYLVPTMEHVGKTALLVIAAPFRR